MGRLIPAGLSSPNIETINTSKNLSAPPVNNTLDSYSSLVKNTFLQPLIVFKWLEIKWHLTANYLQPGDVAIILLSPGPG